MLRLVMGGVSWADTLADYRGWCVSAGTAVGTVELRLSYLRRLADSTDLGPFDLHIDHLAAFLSYPGWAPETRKCARAAVRSFYRWALDTDRIMADPSLKLPSVRVPVGKPKPAPENTVAAALSRADPSQRLMVMLAAFAGLRCDQSRQGAPDGNHPAPGAATARHVGRAR